MTSFDTISLEELMAQAALLTRIDRKYVLPIHAVQDLLNACPGNTRVLQIDGRMAFRYESTYFDTPEFDSYKLAAHSHRRRFKVRTRRYVDTGGAFLEVKLKGLRGMTVKTRIPVGEDEHEAISLEGRRFIASEVGPELLDKRGVESLEPCLHNSYLRTTQLLPDDGARFTVDLDLKWSVPGDTVYGGVERMRCTALAIVETKSPVGRGASEIDRWLWRRGCRPDRMSKFAAGLAALRPELRANRWHRSLDLLKKHSITQSPQPTQLRPITVRAALATALAAE